MEHWEHSDEEIDDVQPIHGPIVKFSYTNTNKVVKQKPNRIGVQRTYKVVNPASSTDSSNVIVKTRLGNTEDQEVSTITSQNSSFISSGGSRIKRNSNSYVNDSVLEESNRGVLLRQKNMTSASRIAASSGGRTLDADYIKLFETNYSKDGRGTGRSQNAKSSPILFCERTYEEREEELRKLSGDYNYEDTYTRYDDIDRSPRYEQTYTKSYTMQFPRDPYNTGKTSTDLSSKSNSTYVSKQQLKTSAATTHCSSSDNLQLDAAQNKYSYSSSSSSLATKRASSSNLSDNYQLHTRASETGSGNQVKSAFVQVPKEKQSSEQSTTRISSSTMSSDKHADIKSSVESAASSNLVVANARYVSNVGSINKESESRSDSPINFVARRAKFEIGTDTPNSSDIGQEHTNKSITVTSCKTTMNDRRSPTTFDSGRNSQSSQIIRTEVVTQSTHEPFSETVMDNRRDMSTSRVEKTLNVQGYNQTNQSEHGILSQEMHRSPSEPAVERQHCNTSVREETTFSSFGRAQDNRALGSNEATHTSVMETSSGSNRSGISNIETHYENNLTQNSCRGLVGQSSHVLSSELNSLIAPNNHETKTTYQHQYIKENNSQQQSNEVQSHARDSFSASEQRRSRTVGDKSRTTESHTSRSQSATRANELGSQGRTIKRNSSFEERYYGNRRYDNSVAEMVRVYEQKELEQRKYLEEYFEEYYRKLQRQRNKQENYSIKSSTMSGSHESTHSTSQLQEPLNSAHGSVSTGQASRQNHIYGSVNDIYQSKEDENRSINSINNKKGITGTSQIQQHSQSYNTGRNTFTSSTTRIDGGNVQQIAVESKNSSNIDTNQNRNTSQHEAGGYVTEYRTQQTSTKTTSNNQVPRQEQYRVERTNVSNVVQESAPRTQVNRTVVVEKSTSRQSPLLSKDTVMESSKLIAQVPQQEQYRVERTNMSNVIQESSPRTQMNNTEVVVKSTSRQSPMMKQGIEKESSTTTIQSREENFNTSSNITQSSGLRLSGITKLNQASNYNVETRNRLTSPHIQNHSSYESKTISRDNAANISATSKVTANELGASNVKVKENTVYSKNVRGLSPNPSNSKGNTYYVSTTTVQTRTSKNSDPISINRHSYHGDSAQESSRSTQQTSRVTNVNQSDRSIAGSSSASQQQTYRTSAYQSSEGILSPLRIMSPVPAPHFIRMTTEAKTKSESYHANPDQKLMNILFHRLNEYNEPISTRPCRMRAQDILERARIFENHGTVKRAYSTESVLGTKKSGRSRTSNSVITTKNTILTNGTNSAFNVHTQSPQRALSTKKSENITRIEHSGSIPANNSLLKSYQSSSSMTTSNRDVSPPSFSVKQYSSTITNNKPCETDAALSTNTRTYQSESKNVVKGISPSPVIENHSVSSQTSTRIDKSVSPIVPAPPSDNKISNVNISTYSSERKSTIEKQSPVPQANARSYYTQTTTRKNINESPSESHFISSQRYDLMSPPLRRVMEEDTGFSSCGSLSPEYSYYARLDRSLSAPSPKQFINYEYSNVNSRSHGNTLNPSTNYDQGVHVIHHQPPDSCQKLSSKSVTETTMNVIPEDHSQSHYVGSQRQDVGYQNSVISQTGFNPPTLHGQRTHTTTEYYTSGISAEHDGTDCYNIPEERTSRHTTFSSSSGYESSEKQSHFHDRHNQLSSPYSSETSASQQEYGMRGDKYSSRGGSSHTLQTTHTDYSSNAAYANNSLNQSFAGNDQQTAMNIRGVQTMVKSPEPCGSSGRNSSLGETSVLKFVINSSGGPGDIEYRKQMYFRALAADSLQPFRENVVSPPPPTSRDIVQQSRRI